MWWQSAITQHLLFPKSLNILKNITSTLFVVSLYINMLFVPLSGIVTSKCIKDSYLPVAYTVNTRPTPYFFFYNCLKRNIYISCCPLAFKTSIVPFFIIRNLQICYSVACLMFLCFSIRYMCCIFQFNL